MMILTDITVLIAIVCPSGKAEIFFITHLNDNIPPRTASTIIKKK